jgi:mono/diheme cytochrome c family protein
MDLSTITSIDLSPLVQPTVEVLAGIFLAVGIWAVKKLSTKLGLEADDKIRSYLLTAVENAVAFGKTKAVEKFEHADWTKVEVKDEILAHAASYVMTRVPDAVKQFKLSEQDIKDMVMAKLGN